MLRGEILTALAMLGHKETLNEATRRFDTFLNDRNTPLLPLNIRKAAYVAVMRSVTSSNRAGSLPSCPDPAIVLEVLKFSLSPEVRSQDAIFGLGVSKEGREVAWTWLKDRKKLWWIPDTTFCQCSCLAVCFI